MIKKYENILLNVNELKLYDRVVCSGSMSRVFTRQRTFDLEGQTGIIISIREYTPVTYCTVYFDNMFSPELVQYEDKTNRLLTVLSSKLEKINVDKSKYPASNFSVRIKSLLEYCDYMECPHCLDIDFIDVNDNNNSYITYLPREKVKKLKENESPWESRMREKMAIGKFLKKLNPFTIPIDLEKKVNIYKAMYNHFINDKSKFNIVKGDDVVKWYQEKKYKKGQGKLNKSCMGRHHDKLFLYTDVKRVAMLILVDEENELLGRALVWNITHPAITYMDRVYTVYPEDENRFYKYAKENGWKTYVNDKNDLMIIRFNHHIGDEFENPYMDTFKYFIEYNGIYGKEYLTNTYENDASYIELEETMGVGEADDYDEF
jgi:hypothetical protein